MTHLQRRLTVIYLYLVPVLLSFGFFVSCKPHENNDLLLTFSSSMIDSSFTTPPPTLTFDTVFTSVGSVTKFFMVHNPSNSDVTTTIYLAGGKTSFYSINVDGDTGTYFKNVVIPKKDSLFIFVKVNVDPKNQNNPFLVSDSVVFVTGKNIQDVKLLAYGQDARYILADKETGYKIVAGANETVTWKKERPYVVYGWAAIDSLGTLIIEPGTKVYFHKNSGLWAYRYSNLQVEGTKEEPVLFRGDRLEKWFDDDYAQWDRIWINEGAEVSINHAMITNAFIGLQIEALPTNAGMINIEPNIVKINNTLIKNTRSYGVLSRFLNVEMTNCVIANNGSCSMLLEIGNYTMKHLTISNDFKQSERKDATCFVSNKIVSVQQGYEQLPAMATKATFTNCIITGRNETEIKQNMSPGADLKVLFENCLVKSKENSDSFIDCLRNVDPKFEDNGKLNFRLKPESPAIGKGKPNIDVLLDILGNARKNPPDIGAYESQ